jgi:hypothetical protein
VVVDVVPKIVRGVQTGSLEVCPMLGVAASERAELAFVRGLDVHLGHAENIELAAEAVSQPQLLGADVEDAVLAVPDEYRAGPGADHHAAVLDVVDVHLLAVVAEGHRAVLAAADGEHLPLHRPRGLHQRLGLILFVLEGVVGAHHVVSPVRLLIKFLAIRRFEYLRFGGHLCWIMNLKLI